MSKLLVGLDIGAQTIKAIQISKDKNKNQLVAAGFIPTPLKNLTLLTANEEQILAKSITRLLHDMKVSTVDISASLPSSRVITRVVDMPYMSEKELVSSISWEAEQYIPLPLSKVKIDYVVIDTDQSSNKMKVLLVAAPVSIIEKYMRVVDLAGLNPVSLETEVLAAGRSITASFPQLSDVLVLIIGATTTEITLSHNHILIYTKSYPFGGNTFTHAIAQEMSFELSQAEEYKKTYGFDESKLEGKIAKILSPFFTTVFSEIEKTIIYFKNQYPKEELKTIILCGGGAKIPGLILAVTKNSSLDCQINDPFANISVDPQILPSLSSDAPIYSIAVGLALKEI